MRVSVRFRLALADLGLLMLEMHCEEEKAQAIIRSRMSSTERAVDDYLRSSSDFNAPQRVREHIHLRLTAPPHYSYIVRVEMQVLFYSCTKVFQYGQYGKHIKISEYPLCAIMFNKAPTKHWSHVIKNIILNFIYIRKAHHVNYIFFSLLNHFKKISV